MTFEVEVNGRIHVVSVDPAGSEGRAAKHFHVAVHGDVRDESSRTPGPQACEVLVQRTDVGLSILYPGTGESVDTSIVERPDGDYLVQVRGVSLAVSVNGRRLRRAHADMGKGTGEQRLTAPMPGRIVRVLVKPGDEVGARQGLIVIEAMKMENELTVPRPGRVVEVNVSEGASVEAGRLLVRLE